MIIISTNSHEDIAILAKSKSTRNIKNLKDIIEKRLEFYKNLYFFYYETENVLFTLVSVEYLPFESIFKTLIDKIKKKYPMSLTPALVLLQVSSFVEIIQEFSF
jgi:hypothetical protein